MDEKSDYTSGKYLCLTRRRKYPSFAFQAFYKADLTHFIAARALALSYLLLSLAHKFLYFVFCHKNQQFWHPCKVVTAGRQLYEGPWGEVTTIWWWLGHDSSRLCRIKIVVQSKVQIQSHHDKKLSVVFLLLTEMVSWLRYLSTSSLY